MLSVVVGFLGGLSAIVIKNSVHFIRILLTSDFTKSIPHILYVFYPLIGILLVILFSKYILKKPVGHGIPAVLFAISKKNGLLARHQMFSSVITSTLTVGFGGSVGLEGPVVSTGAAIGSNLGRIMQLNYKQIILMIAVASSAAMAAIFQAPIAAVLFSVEVIMIDMTMYSIIPLLIASVTAVLTSYYFLGQAVLYPFEIEKDFYVNDVPYFIALGVVGGLVSIYFTRIYIFIERLFRLIKPWYLKWLAGGGFLGILIFIFPSLYGEGYESVNMALSGDPGPLFNNSIFYPFREETAVLFMLFALIILLKVVATSLTFGGGGVGGIFAPALFTGVFTGLFFGKIINFLHLGPVSEGNLALAGMGGVIAGVLHAPLTGIFLIAEITGGYQLLVPLIITAAISYATTKILVTNSVYTHILARRGQLLTHHKDKTVLSLLKVKDLIDTNCICLKPEDNLGDIVKVITGTDRTVFPVVDQKNNFKGMVILDDVRNIMFQTEKYTSTFVHELLFYPPVTVNLNDSMEEVVYKFQQTGKNMLVVLDSGKFTGFVSQSTVFSAYRKMMKYLSDD
jgi:CIC family chloride channel protein